MNVNRLIFWDIDGTLMHCGSDGRKALNWTFFELYGITNAFNQVTIGGAMDSNLIVNIMKNFRIDRKDYHLIVKRYKKNLTDVLENNKKKRILPGVVTLLDTIKQNSDSINALLTSNLKIGAEAKLRSVGLIDYFDMGGFGDELGEKWDAAESCIQLAEDVYQTSFKKEHIFLIGDSCYDVFCAKKLGINSVAVATGWAEPKTLIDCKPSYYFSDLSDTDQVLEALDIFEK